MFSKAKQINAIKAIQINKEVCCYRPIWKPVKEKNAMASLR